MQATLPAVLGEVVLATKEANVKTRGAAFDLLLALAAAAEKRAPGGTEHAQAEAVRAPACLPRISLDLPASRRPSPHLAAPRCAPSW